MVSFRASGENAAVVQPSVKRYAKHYVEIFREYKADGCYNVVKGTSLSGEFRPMPNGFVHGVIDAYNGHHNLLIRPDDVWLAIVAQFGLFVNGNADAMRSVFVDHEGWQRKTLTVRQTGTSEAADNELLAMDMVTELRNNVKAEVCNWILPGFSTTTRDDVVVASVLLMAKFKHTFGYVLKLDCGIPEVTLEGTVKDWESIHRRVNELNKYGLNCRMWSSMLEYVTRQLVESSKGNVSIDFWSTVCNQVGFGSSEIFISSWLSAFCVFDNEGKWQIGYEPQAVRFNTGRIPAGYRTADVKVVMNEMEYETLMFAGHMGYGVAEDRRGIAPKVSWALSLKSSEMADTSGTEEFLDIRV